MNKMIKAYFYILLISARSILSAHACFAENRPINELPMYGGLHDPEVEPDLKSSQGLGKLGWDYYYKNDLDTAIKRFNQAWMFNRKNVDALWGFGLIMAKRADEERPEYHYKESIRFLEMAIALQPENPNIIVDIAYTHTIFGNFMNENNKPESKVAFKKTHIFYKKAEKLNSQFPPLHLNWSVLEFCQGNYEKAQERLAKAKSLGYKSGSAYEKELLGKLISEPNAPVDR